MKYLVFILFFCSQKIFSQTELINFSDNLCSFKTDGQGKSRGLKIKFAVPCKWKEQEGERPHVVKKFIYLFPNLSSLIETIVINTFPEKPSKSEIAEMLSENSLIESCRSLGTCISVRKVNVDGIDCGETIFSNSRESPTLKAYSTSIQYFFVYEDKMIVITYAAFSDNNLISSKLFTQYKFLFQSLAGRTIFLSQWSK